VQTGSGKKGRDGRGLAHKEEKMCKVFTSTELDRLTKTELSALFKKVSGHLGRTDPGSPERRNCLASLENIERTVIQRRKGPKPSF
jgi:hypothetical protein